MIFIKPVDTDVERNVIQRIFCKQGRIVHRGGLKNEKKNNFLI